MPVAEYEAVHRAAFAGEITGNEARRRAAALSKGVRLIGSGDGDPDAEHVRRIGNQAAILASEVRGLKRMADAGRLPTDSGRVLIKSLSRVVAAMEYTFGREQAEAIIVDAFNKPPPAHNGRAAKPINEQRRLM